MDRKVYNSYVDLLRRELVPALGCTEPIAIAFAAAKAREVLGCEPEKIVMHCSGNIIKNVQGVTVPTSGGLRGIAVAAILGAVGGDASKNLEALTGINDAHRARMRELLDQKICTCELAENVDNLYILAELSAGDQTAAVEVSGSHTNITRIERNGEVLFRAETKNVKDTADKSLLKFRDILEFAETVDLDDVRDVLKRQIDYNEAIADEGLKGKYGVNVGRELMDRYDPSDVRIRARARAAAGSDARMGGCSMPVVINSGSGNQGMTVSLPVIEYARDMKASEDRLYRALVVANLTSLLQKRYIGDLSAFCGATSAAAGATAGIAWLKGFDEVAIERTITNTIASIGGMVCDGAKASCAYKIALALEAAILGMELGGEDGRSFAPGEGLVQDDIEKTIANVGRMGRDGMKSTDVEILKIMIGQ